MQKDKHFGCTGCAYTNTELNCGIDFLRQFCYV